jgi:hypothetical protein
MCFFPQQDSQLVLITVHNIVTHTLSQWENMELKDIEVAITLLYTLAEAMPVSMQVISVDKCISFSFF